MASTVTVVVVVVRSSTISSRMDVVDGCLLRRVMMQLTFIYICIDMRDHECVGQCALLLHYSS